MKLRLLCLLLLWGSISTLFAQKKETYTISGYIQDADSGEKLISANIYDYKSGKGTVSNTYGFYSLTLPKDSVLLTISYIGLKEQNLSLYLDKDINLNIDLSTDLSFEEIEVVSSRVEQIEESTRMGTVDIPIAQIKKIPALFGEVDVLKALQLLPGVQSGGEGQSGLYVRGGSPDQNLLLLDGVPVYNASHLFGFFSVFNADAIKDVTLTKGGFPARYGGRLSSVIEINMKEGDNNDWHGTGTIGLVASKFTIEGPIKKDKTSLLLSGRRTYIDILARPLIKSNLDGEGDLGYYFHDVNAKLNHKFSDKDRLYLSLYTGDDNFYFNEVYNQGSSESTTKAGLRWGNLTSALRWNHQWGNKLFSNTTLTYSKYRFRTDVLNGDKRGIEESRYGLGYLSGIYDVAGKIDFDYIPNPNHYIRFGVSTINHKFKPGRFKFESKETDEDGTTVIDTVIGQPELKALEFAGYVEDDFQIGDNFKLNAGVHFSAFAADKKTYTSIQPRLSVRYLLPDGTALKGSYASMRQYIQLLTNDGVGLPTDLWLPTTDKVKPQDSWQVAIGAAKTFNKKYEISIEAYYKDMNNLLSYKEGAGVFQFNNWEERVTQGKGKSYGVELFVQKKIGRLTGWVGYTWSKTNRTFEDINAGRTFDYKYDRRHDASLVLSYQFNDRVELSGAWVYGTGNAMTLPNSSFRVTYPSDLPGLDQYNNGFNISTLESYEDRNNFRMRAYHRLDIGVNFHKQKKRYKRTWSFGAYNAYSNKNPFFVYVGSEYNQQTEREKGVLKQVSLFPIIPYFAWKFEF